MKTFLLSLAITTIFLSACNSNSNQTAKNQTPAKKIALTGTGNSPVKDIISSYLQLKNALVNDDDKSAATAGNVLKTAVEKVTLSSLEPAQAKVFNDIADDVKEHGEHIGANAGNIKHQREHFEMLSQEIYDLVKTDKKSGQKLYYDHCPMYNNKKGGNWISETKDIRNPYLGKEMVTCGSQSEELN
jgi:ABC-type Fe3+-hydroxamate transport system substrate-binding protein